MEMQIQLEDYLSFPLWDKYIEYEYTQQEWSRLAMIYTRILETPNQQLNRYFNSFKELTISRPLSELRTSEETATAIAMPVAPLSKVDGQEIEGEACPYDAEESSLPSGVGATLREKYIVIREDV